MKAKRKRPRRRRAPGARFLLLPLALTGTAAFGGPPLSYLTSAGGKADSTLALTWGLLAISIAVVVIMIGLTCVGIWRRGDRNPSAIAAAVRETDASAWLYIGVGVSTFVLVISLVWTIRVLAHVSRAPTPPALTIEVSGQQWWWKARYLDADPSRIVTTANEIHIPVGSPVRVRLVGVDVIHSFWVPALAGKTDVVPGQVNETWLEADRPGRYRGQCTEYCGVQHAHMAFDVVAEPPAVFRAWLATQLAPAAPPVAPAAIRGERNFEFRCGACHTVRGTAAGGTAAPDLTHLMSRATIAAGSAPNTPAMLAAWMANPQALKPGNNMPTLQLSGAEIGDIDAYLATLK